VVFLTANLTPRTVVADLNAWLEYTVWEVSQRFPNDTSRPYIHPRIIRWPVPASRENWRQILGDSEVDDAADFGEFFKRPTTARSTRNIWLGLVASWSGTWVATPESEWLDGWHAWAFALVKDPQGGKHLLIWDCDSKMDLRVGLGPTQRPREVFLGLQTKLYERARKEGMNIYERVWAGTTHDQGGLNLCLRFSAEWLRSVALNEDSHKPWNSVDRDIPDVRFTDFRRFQRQ